MASCLRYFSRNLLAERFLFMHTCAFNQIRNSIGPRSAAGTWLLIQSATARGITMAQLKDKVKTTLDEGRILVIGAQVLLGFQLRAILETGFEKLPEHAKYMKLGGIGRACEAGRPPPRRVILRGVIPRPNRCRVAPRG